MSRINLIVFALAGLLLQQTAHAVSDGDGEQSLADFSIEQLTEITVHSVSRQSTRLADAPAAVYVVSGEDIRRSGALSIPEALRLAPNLQVARSSGQGYAITARGLSSGLENKLLVMIDGRSVYSPLFSGVFWDMQDVVMQDIDRIEVISGPGSTIWGANAVNGVINIITKPARATQGTYASVSAGEHTVQETVRYGATMANGAAYRVYGQNTRGDGEGEGNWHRSQTGFRIDLGDADGRTGGVSGDGYTGDLGRLSGRTIEVAGANLLAHVEARVAGGDLRLQAYIDHTERDEPGLGAQRLNTLDLDAQLDLAVGRYNQLAIGGGARTSHDRIDNRGLMFTPASRTLQWANLFAQDELTLAPGVRLTGGLKFEHNSYTGMEMLPSVRLAWSPGADALLWGAASRTVRAPSRLERDLTLPRAASDGALVNVTDASDNFVSETAQVLELGYRVQPANALAWSATLFYSDYDRLRTLEPGTGASGGATFGNLGHGTARGLELSSRWQVTPAWRLDAGAVVQRITSGTDPASGDAAAAAGLATADPSHYWTVRSSHILSSAVRADLALRHVGSLPAPAVPAYSELDVRVAWQLSRHVELALAGRNLLHAYHAEYGSNVAQANSRQAIARSVYATASVRF